MLGFPSYRYTVALLAAVEGQPLVMVTPEARLVADAQKRVRSLPMARAAGLCA